MVLDQPLRLEIHDSGSAPQQWASLLAVAPGVDFFHTSSWIQVVAKFYPHLSPFWMLAFSGDQLVGGLAGQYRESRMMGMLNVHHLESNWEGTSGGPLVHGELSEPDQQKVFQFLIKALQDHRNDFLGGYRVSLNTHYDDKFGNLLKKSDQWQRRDVPGAVIDLTQGLEQVEMGLMHMNKRNERNRGLKRGAVVFVTNEEKWLDGYYPIYQQANRIWGAEPIAYELLRDLLLLGPEKTFFTCIKLEERVIGGHLNLVHDGQVMAWNGVTDPAFAKTHFPATLAVWGDLVESCRRGARSLDLGASGGVRSLTGFKKYFGAEIQERGFYVSETARLKFLRQVHGSLAQWKMRLPGKASQQRWHDKDREPSGKIVPDNGETP